jgi:hypothetical protein
MSIGVSCNKKEEPTTSAKPPAASAAQAPAPQAAPVAQPTVAASVPQPAADAGAVLAKAGPADAYAISVNPELKGRLGQLVVAFPEGVNLGNTHIFVYKEQNEITNFYGNKTVDLMPGTYAVAINGKRVEGVAIQSGHDSKVKVGMLRVNAGKDTHVFLLDADKKRELINGYGNQELGFPIGTVYVSVAGQSEPVTIQEGKITDF